MRNRTYCLFGLVLLAACNKPEAAGTTDAAPASTAAASAAPTIAATASASAVTAPMADAGATAAPGARSKVPTPAEWNEQKNIEVAGVTKLGCDVRRLREWIRISCRDKNDTGGTPTTVTLAKPKMPDVFTFGANKIASLVAPFEPGTAIDATFVWSNGSRAVSLTWPKGGAEPSPLFAFGPSKAAFVYDPKKPAGTLACECELAAGTSMCEPSTLGAGVGDCERTYPTDCAKISKCIGGDKSALPTCLPGSKLVGTACKKG